MEPARDWYRMLPGWRRGFIFGSSVWMASDHLLLVKSARFREEYKRFFFRDIQAIVMTSAPRFHISTRSAWIALLWLCAYGIGSLSALPPDLLKWALGLIGFLVVFVWAYVSARSSCRCRIYTAVSSEALPSLYRTWTAERFMKKVEPAIAQAQGTIEGNWAEAVDDQQVGPQPERRIGPILPGAVAPLPSPAPPPSVQSARSPVSILFVASLCLGGLAELLTIRASAQSGRWILLGFLLLQIVAAVSVLVQNYRGTLPAAMRNLAIVTLAAVGLWYYSVQMAMGAIIGFQNSASHGSQQVRAQMDALMVANHPIARAIAGGTCLLLGVVGLILLLRAEPAEEQASLNV
jgi:hypothetical protein